MNCLKQPTNAAKSITKYAFTKECFGAIDSVKKYKTIANGDIPVAATLQRKSSGGTSFVAISKLLQNHKSQGINL